MTNSSDIAVFGATGHTGRFVLAELQQRGFRARAIGRNKDKLDRLTAQFNLTDVRFADLDDNASLDDAVRDAQLIINCAGPFLDTAEPVIAAALRAGISYIDVTAEQITALNTFHRHHAARKAGIVILPAAAFYGGLADLMASCLIEDLPEADTVEVAIALDSWHPTQGTRQTGARNTMPRMILKDGRFQGLDSPQTQQFREFGDGFGRQEMTQVSLSEIITISRHLPVRNINALMNLAPIQDLRDASTPEPKAVDAAGRSAQRFEMMVRISDKAEQRQMKLAGQDIYAFSATMVAEAALWSIERQISGNGVLALGEAFNARKFLAALCRNTNAALSS